MTKKLQSSLAVEGELPEDGLAVYEDDADDLMFALARRIVSGEEDADSVESVFAEAQQVAAEAEALLVDEGWDAPEPEPLAVEAGPSVELVAANGRDDDSAGAQRSLFSWAEFMAEEPVKPKGRGRKPQPATAESQDVRRRHRPPEAGQECRGRMGPSGYF